MIRMVLLILLLMLVPLAAFTQTASITQCEWFTGADPGAGSGNPITIGASGSSVGLSFSVATGSFLPGITHVKIRCKADSIRSSSAGVWGVPTDGYVIVTPGSSTVRLVTQFEYRVDNGSWTSVNPTDAAQININEIVPTTGLDGRMHRLEIRLTDDLNRTGVATNGYFAVLDPTASHWRLVTQIQYWFDSNSPTTLDVTDNPSVNVNEMISSAGLSVGLHQFNMRPIDNLGRIGPTTNVNLIVTSPFGPGAQRSIVAAEYFVNVDPGAGNGVAIPLPDDGAWDEGNENVTQIVTGLPIGLHLVGFRVQDNTGRWSMPEMDSVLVGPILVVHSSGSNIILDWQSGSGVSQYKIYRSPTVSGTYALIDSTTSQTYTDATAIPSSAMNFYYVTFEAAARSSFRIPGDTPVRE